MTTFDEAAHPRHHTGQFATKERTEPDVSLAVREPTAAEEHRSQAEAASAAVLRYQEVTRQLERQVSATKVRALAAHAAADFPGAHTLVLAQSDEQRDRWEVEKIIGGGPADTVLWSWSDVSDERADVEEWGAQTSVLTGGLGPHARHVPGFEREVDSERGCPTAVLIDIEAALEPESDGGRWQQVERGAQLAEVYASVHGTPADQEPSTVLGAVGAWVDSVRPSRDREQVCEDVLGVLGVARAYPGASWEESARSALASSNYSLPEMLMAAASSASRK